MPDDPPEKSWPFICPHCERPANAIARGKAVWDGWNEEGEPENPPVEWSLVQCHRCAQPTLQAREDFGGGFADDEHPATVYPARRQLPGGVPAGLRREWEEARSCFDAKAYAACVVMVRRTLEGTCAEQGVKAKNLSKALKELADTGRIDQTLAEWANVLRRVGNKGAHYTGEAVPRQDAEDALALPRRCSTTSTCSVVASTSSARVSHRLASVIGSRRPAARALERTVPSHDRRVSCWAR